MTLTRTSLSIGDSIWVGRSYINFHETHATVDFGVIVAVDERGSIVYRDDGGHIHDVPWYAKVSLHTGEREAWAAVADAVGARAAELTKIAAECRAKASVEVVA